VLIAQRRAKKLALLLREGMADLMQNLRTNIPSGIADSAVPDEFMVYQYAGVELEEEEKERKRSVDIATMVEQKLSGKLSKIEELSRSVSIMNSDIKTLQEDIGKLKTARKTTSPKKTSTQKSIKRASTSKPNTKKK
jgi:hypothetical protein